MKSIAQRSREDAIRIQLLLHAFGYQWRSSCILSNTDSIKHLNRSIDINLLEDTKQLVHSSEHVSELVTVEEALKIKEKK